MLPDVIASSLPQCALIFWLKQSIFIRLTSLIIKERRDSKLAKFLKVIPKAEKQEFCSLIWCTVAFHSQCTGVEPKQW